MDILNLLEQVHLDPIIILLVVCGGFWAKRYLSTVTEIRGVKLMTSWKTLFVGTVLTGAYITILAFIGDLSRDMVADFFISYTVATSLYELFIGPVVKFLGGKNDNVDKDQ